MLGPASPPAGSLECSGISGCNLHISPEGKEGRVSGRPEAGAPNPPSLLWGGLTALSPVTKCPSRRPGQLVPAALDRPCALPRPQPLTRRASAWLCRQRLEPTVRTPDRPNSERPGASSTGPSSGTWFTSGWGLGQEAEHPPPHPHPPLRGCRPGRRSRAGVSLWTGGLPGWEVSGPEAEVPRWGNSKEEGCSRAGCPGQGLLCSPTPPPTWPLWL